MTGWRVLDPAEARAHPDYGIRGWLAALMWFEAIIVLIYAFAVAFKAYAMAGADEYFAEFVLATIVPWADVYSMFSITGALVVAAFVARWSLVIPLVQAQCGLALLVWTVEIFRRLVEAMGEHEPIVGGTADIAFKWGRVYEILQDYLFIGAPFVGLAYAVHVGRLPNLTFRHRIGIETTP